MPSHHARTYPAPTTPLRTIVLACAMLGAAPVWADDTPPAVSEAASNIDQVTVVGSRARNRTVFDSSVPIDRFGTREVDNALASGDVGAALQALSPSINFPRIESSGASDSVRGIQLRGLAPDQVLVLINGKRRHTSAVLDTESSFAGTVPVDINAIPPNAIDHIEILRDGAGAQYGSDAVAGVINIVLKKARTGGSASVSYGANHTHFDPTNQTLTDGQTVIVNADYGVPLGDTGFFRFGAESRRRSPTERAGPSDAGWTSSNSTPADLALDGKVLFKSGDSRQHNNYLFYNTQFTLDNGIDLYSFATLNDRKSDGSAYFRYPGDPSNVLSLYPNGYRPVTNGNKRDISVVAGARGSIADWNWDASARHGSDRFDYGVSHSVNASLGAASPTSFHLASFDFRQNALNLDATRTVDIGLPAPLNVAVGAEWMRETYQSSSGDPASYAAGSITDAPPGAQAGPGLRPSDAYDGSRQIRSIYADVESDITQRLLLGAAARYSDYSDFGSASTGKLSARYKVTNDFLLRGSLSNSFRAPALVQTGFRFATLNFNSDGTALQTSALLPASDPLARSFGAQPLKPEKSTNLSLGLAWKLASATSLTVDAYVIRIRDRITRSSDLQSDAVTTYLESVGRSDIQSVAYLANLLDTRTKGLDVVLNHDLPFANGKLNLNAALNLNKTSLDKVRQSSAALSAIDPSLTLLTDTSLFRIKNASPTSKLILGADWQTAGWGVQVRATRFGELKDFSYDSDAPLIDGIPAQRFGAVWSLDLEGQIKLSKQLTLSLGGNNILDRYPQRVRETNNATYGGALPYNFINPIGVNGAYFYGKLSYTF
ncbi:MULTISPECIES: TonB-dependent siderophore receptor [unclassified Janthinobacterium]|uniref:TonB-dependent receptor plug domain-containing protein n=1 Tax=unclassified Janthinobacterium TaxID=2610881 RepID=UPI0017AEAC0F|nr:MULTISPECIES: TonB-dependent receptor [unclassified Janthinobacterium]MBB5369396.1 iron complex outermembrane receptor protein [Janthinobacterium sp. K2C7]MBB5381068.1 iron complex outermembrane receptor protein [Janthinobacterium sp. K2Li3]MBB5387779.1 iron complex outermembrane receptor protein [Janthinobacterium sp. K2E3]